VARLVVVSNRVAAPDEHGKQAPGGLAVAVAAAMHEREGIWFGWSGNVSDEPPEPTTTEIDHVRYVLTDLRSSEFDEYYNGFANRVLWPILHYRVDLAEFTAGHYEGYLRVNQFFAERLGPLLRPDDIVWVHDYHLMPMARALRRLGHRNRLGFFLHIPMPPPDILTALPKHEVTIGALVDFDLIGFQTESDAANFARYLTTVAGAASRDRREYQIGTHTFRIGVFPVGVDPQQLRRLASRASQSAFIRELRESLSDRRLIIGVDRLDYSKGILQRIDAYEWFLRTAEPWRDRVTFLQIAPKSRSEIPEYAEMDAEVGGRVGRINGEYGHVAWVPLRYVNRNYRRGAVAAMLRLADVGLVTPLRDGMNLVAKEFIAAQDPDDPGVLVLSQFAGAASELNAALLVNPHDREGMAAAIRNALEMPREERIARHRDMYATLVANDIRYWAKSFIDALTNPGRPSRRWLAPQPIV
jgi:trehalose 6-phosphate synthase